MRYVISGKNIDVTEGLRTAITDKLGKLERYFTPDTEVHVTLSVEKERQKIEVTIPVKGTVIRSVCIHRSGGGGHRASAPQVQEQDRTAGAGSRKLPSGVYRQRGRG